MSNLPLFVILILVFCPILVVLRLIAAAPDSGRIKTWLNSPATGFAPPYWVVFTFAGIANLRHLFEDEPCYWPAALAFGLALLSRIAKVHDRGDVQRVLDPLLGVRRGQP
jgi:hypothetical protein